MAGRRTSGARTVAATDTAPTTPPSPDPFAVAARAGLAREGHANVSDDQAPEAQAADDATPLEGNEQEGQAPEQSTPPQDGGDDSQKDDVTQAELKKLRAEAAKYRKQARDYEAKAEQQRQAAMSEDERREARIAELEAERQAYAERMRTLAIESAVALRSNALGFVDADAAVKLIDADALEFSDDGTPDAASVDLALRALLKAKPYLKAQQAPGSPANPAKERNVGETDAQRRARLYGGGGTDVLAGGVVPTE